MRSTGAALKVQQASVYSDPVPFFAELFGRTSVMVRLITALRERAPPVCATVLPHW
jgi:hypothetical protein